MVSFRLVFRGSISMENINQKSCMHIISLFFVTFSVLFTGCLLEGDLNERLSGLGNAKERYRYPTITITGIPSRYFGWEADINGVGSIPIVITSETITLYWTYWEKYVSIPLYLEDGDARMVYYTSQININAGNNIIPFSEFLNNTMTITITGIPSQYNNAIGILWQGGTGHGSPRVTGNSIVFNGVYSNTSEIRLELLHINMGTGATAGTMTISGNSSIIPWSAFTEVPSITVTGIPSNFAPSRLIYINISTPGTTNWSGHGSAQASRKNDWVSSNLWTANSGVYDVRLYTYDFSGNIIIDEYHTFSRNIGTGNNIIAFSSFILQY